MPLFVTYKAIKVKIKNPFGRYTKEGLMDDANLAFYRHNLLALGLN